MKINIEVYLKTEMYAKDEIIEGIKKLIKSEKNLNIEDKVFSGLLPDEVKFIRIDGEISVLKKNMLSDVLWNFYFVPSLDSSSPSEEVIFDGETSSTSSHNWVLPNQAFDGLWETLFLSNDVKQNLLRYATVCIEFGKKGIDPNIVLCNRLIFLHGPPGTGKTTICKAIAQKLSIRLMESFPLAQLIEINCHSLLSKWFSESGKLVSKLFETIRSYANTPEMLVVVLIDEVESLTSARQTALNSNEPSDAIRVVNAVLTQLDSLRHYPNVLILATSNISDAIDPAFKDRADFVQHIGLPGFNDIQKILKSCFLELDRVKIFPYDSDKTEFLNSVEKIAKECEGLSGRAIRKLPIVTFALMDEPTVPNFLARMPEAVNLMHKDIKHVC